MKTLWMMKILKMKMMMVMMNNHGYEPKRCYYEYIQYK